MKQVKATFGVVEQGPFLGMTEHVYIAGTDGVRYADQSRQG